MRVTLKRSLQTQPKAIHLVAPTAAAPHDQLLKARGRIARQRTSELNIEVLVRDVFDVAAMQAGQRVEVRPGMAFEADTVEIGSEVHATFLCDNAFVRQVGQVDGIGRVLNLGVGRRGVRRCSDRGSGRVLMYGGPTMKDGMMLAEGKVTLTVDHMGPVRIAAYLVELADGGYALSTPALIPGGGDHCRSASARCESEDDAPFLTHARRSFRRCARLSAGTDLSLAADAATMRRSGWTVHDLAQGARTPLAGTIIETIAVPGHTAGSAAYLIDGVLFLGDAAAAISETELASNDYAFTTDVQLNHRSLQALAARLRTRPGDVHSIAFGHQGPVKGLDPLLKWASESATASTSVSSSGKVSR
jgi:glyoxylase-like metal-dependent hydrolase (beta-lactamase superfamily II)